MKALLPLLCAIVGIVSAVSLQRRQFNVGSLPSLDSFLGDAEGSKPPVVAPPPSDTGTSKPQISPTADIKPPVLPPAPVASVPTTTLLPPPLPSALLEAFANILAKYSPSQDINSLMTEMKNVAQKFYNGGLIPSSVQNFIMQKYQELTANKPAFVDFNQTLWSLNKTMDGMTKPNLTIVEHLVRNLTNIALSFKPQSNSTNSSFELSGLHDALSKIFASNPQMILSLVANNPPSPQSLGDYVNALKSLMEYNNGLLGENDRKALGAFIANLQNATLPQLPRFNITAPTKPEDIAEFLEELPEKASSRILELTKKYFANGKPTRDALVALVREIKSYFDMIQNQLTVGQKQIVFAFLQGLSNMIATMPTNTPAFNVSASPIGYQAEGVVANLTKIFSGLPKDMAGMMNSIVSKYYVNNTLTSPRQFLTELNSYLAKISQSIKPEELNLIRDIVAKLTNQVTVQPPKPENVTEKVVYVPSSINLTKQGIEEYFSALPETLYKDLLGVTSRYFAANITNPTFNDLVKLITALREIVSRSYGKVDEETFMKFKRYIESLTGVLNSQVGAINVARSVEATKEVIDEMKKEVQQMVNVWIKSNRTLEDVTDVKIERNWDAGLNETLRKEVREAVAEVFANKTIPKFDEKRVLQIPANITVPEKLLKAVRNLTLEQSSGDKIEIAAMPKTGSDLKSAIRFNFDLKPYPFLRAAVALNGTSVLRYAIEFLRIVEFNSTVAINDSSSVVDLNFNYGEWSNFTVEPDGNLTKVSVTFQSPLYGDMQFTLITFISPVGVKGGQADGIKYSVLIKDFPYQMANSKLAIVQSIRTKQNTDVAYKDGKIQIGGNYAYLDWVKTVVIDNVTNADISLSSLGLVKDEITGQAVYTKKAVFDTEASDRKFFAYEINSIQPVQVEWDPEIAINTAAVEQTYEQQQKSNQMGQKSNSNSVKADFFTIFAGLVCIALLL